MGRRLISPPFFLFAMHRNKKEIKMKKLRNALFEHTVVTKKFTSVNFVPAVKPKHPEYELAKLLASIANTKAYYGYFNLRMWAVDWGTKKSHWVPREPNFLSNYVFYPKNNVDLRKLQEDIDRLVTTETVTTKRSYKNYKNPALRFKHRKLIKSKSVKYTRNKKDFEAAQHGAVRTDVTNKIKLFLQSGDETVLETFKEPMSSERV